MASAVATAAATCPSTGSSSGCPKTIPSLTANVDYAAPCSQASGQWGTGSVCTVSCADGYANAGVGGGHRRAQVGGSTYICTQGGDWVSSSPLNCVSGGSGAVGPAPSGSSGRFVLVPQLMNIDQAVQLCRTQYASLASIHSWAEQQQAKDVCESAPGERPGCWIGLEDSAAEGGFVWTDGTNVDFVDFTPGEPNGGIGESAVALTFRNSPHRNHGSDTGAGQWNDETRNPDMSSPQTPVRPNAHTLRLRKSPGSG